MVRLSATYRFHKNNLLHHVRRLRTYPLPILIATSGVGIVIILLIVLGCLYVALPLPDVRFHRLAILIPFRDRFDELLQFVPHMHVYLTSQKIKFDIFVVNQVDDFRFNRAALINAGFTIVKESHDYIAMHDVDLLPKNPALNYGFPIGGTVMHLAAPELHPRYHYAKYIGGILLVGRDDFERVNGMSNKYWGWGMEDDEFYVRLNESGIMIRRPSEITTGYKTFLHIHDARHRKRDMERLPGQRQSMKKRDREGGLRTVSYSLRSRQELRIDGFPCTILNVQLNCDILKTPWCVLPQNISSSTTGGRL